jgi:predicted secreted protein
LPDFSKYDIPKQGKIYQNYQTTITHAKWPKNIQIFSIPRPSKIYLNWDFWFENIPSGNPDTYILNAGDVG